MIPYRHSLVVVRPDHSGALDAEGADLGVPTGAERVSASFVGLIQPKSGRERATATGEGPSVGAFRIYLPIRDLGPDDVLRKTGTPDSDLNGDYRVIFVGNAAGMGHHLEVDADRLVPTSTATP